MNYVPFGAPQDYINAFGVDGILTYPEPRVYIEHQTWATPPGVLEGHHSHHIHEGAALPLGVTFTDELPWTSIDVGYTFHNVADYHVLQSAMSAVTQDGSRSIWKADEGQIAALEAGMDASSGGAVVKVFQSYPIARPTRNGLKELRGGILVDADGPSAIFKTWKLDQRAYYTDNYSGLPSSTAFGNQQALRLRSQVSFPKSGDPTIIQTDYHHSGWSGMDGNYGSLTGQGSSAWTRETFLTPWSTTEDKRIGLYVTDGGGPAKLMIDPDFHNHYPAPTDACPNVDASGNCLGKWLWEPPNARKEIFGGVPHTEVVIPASVLASLSPGLHKLVFLSTDRAECRRAGNPCPPDERGSWTNISALAFLIADTQAPSTPTGLAISNPTPSSVLLSWNASADENGVAGYRVYRDGALFVDTAEISITVTGLSASSHPLDVEAYDAAGNVSERASVKVTRTWR